jgi:hypothetical protein
MTLTAKEQLEQLRANLRLKEEASKPKVKVQKADVVYKHWDIPLNSEAVVRFLPDLDTNNPEGFWVTKLTINLPFSGQVGGDYPTDNDVSVTVPCMEMFGKPCPIISAIRPWWKDDAKKEMARQYYKKKSYIFQGFVVSSPFEETNAPENPIRRFSISQSIYEIIYAGIMNPEYEDMLTDFVTGRDFKIKKTQKGEYANYGSSGWRVSPRALSENELIAIEEYGLFNLKEQLGQEPDSDGVEAIKQMFKDSIEGKPFDFDSFGHLYRAYGARSDDNNASVETAVRTTVNRTTPVSDVMETKVETVSETPVATKSNMSEILERLKAKTTK